MSQSDKIGDIVNRYSPPLLDFINSRVKCREDAEDILQDVFYQLVRVNSDNKYSIERVSSWLYRVANNMVMNFWRRQREVSMSSLFDAEDEICAEIAQALACRIDDGPETAYFRKLVWEELDDALSELPAEQCEAFYLTVFDRMPVKEIAAATGVPVATILSRKHYAVKSLRKRFHELYYALMSDQ